MSTVPFFLFAWAIQAVIGAMVVSPVAFLARKRVHWRSWELLSLVVPFCVWLAFMLSDFSTGFKSLSNFAIEPGILGLALGVGALARVAMSTRIPERRAAVAALVGMCLVAVGIFWIVPGLEE